jgi:hypothetical protein
MHVNLVSINGKSGKLLSGYCGTIGRCAGSNYNYHPLYLLVPYSSNAIFYLVDWRLR